MTRLRKHIFITVLVVIAFLCATIFYLVKNANEILKTQLEKSLGEDFRVERTVLNWGSVDAYGIRLLKNGEEIARVGHINIRADFLGFLKTHYSISAVTIEEPYLKVVVDKQGILRVPFVAGVEKKEVAEENKKVIAFEIGRIIIENGRLFLQDARILSAENTIVLRDLNLRLDNLAYPFENVFSGIKLSTVSEGKIISGRAGAVGKVNLKTGSLDLHFEGTDIVILDLDKKGPILSSESMEFSVSSKEDSKGKYYFFDKVILNKPYLRYETDNEGELASPWKEVIEELTKVFAASPSHQ